MIAKFKSHLFYRTKFRLKFCLLKLSDQLETGDTIMDKIKLNLKFKNVMHSRNRKKIR